MKLRHPLTGDTYTRRDHDTVEVETREGRKGVFTRRGEWIRGEVREADPHLAGLVCAPNLGGGGSARASGGRRGVGVPNI